jgi:peptide/nickel transport system ATP-binding protein|tara:strand:- start:1495 stop:2511 length:1017 start_codon:yes stop_codon:yes gene_type:complete
VALLEIKNLKVYYKTRRGINQAVDGISFEVEEGQSMGLVGESGCGKSTLARAIIRVMSRNAIIAGGEIHFEGSNILEYSEKQMREIRWTEMALVPQAAMDSLNPVYTIENQFKEILTKKSKLRRKEAKKRAKELFQMVALDSHYLNRYPHEFSGGMKQRAVIALAFSLNPKLLITDEPVTALDVIVQNQVLRELKQLRARFNVALIMITHDISVVAETCDLIAVMYAGKIVERGPAREVLKHSIHPYTMGLENAFPNLVNPREVLISIEGAPPDLVDPPVGCRFTPRCPFRLDICEETEPNLIEFKSTHFSACHRLDELDMLRAKTTEVDTWRKAVTS